MNIVALTGAGVSKASGVPTFLEMGDLRDKLSRNYFNKFPQDFYGVLNTMKELTDKARPNNAHHALAKHNIPVVTMNIDGLHHAAGSKDADVIEIHGSLLKVFCPQCNTWYDFSVTKHSIYCTSCVKTLLEPDVVLYGDSIPRLYHAIETVSKADLLLIIGTSFYTSTATYISDAAKNTGARVKIINEEAEIIVPELLDKLKK